MLQEDKFSLNIMYSEMLDWYNDWGNECDDEEIADNYNSFDEIFDKIFNSDYFIIGRYEASKALETFIFDGNEVDGTFGAINYIKDCNDEYGLETDSDTLCDPEKVANLVAYYRGNEAFQIILDNLDYSLDDALTKNNVHEFFNEVKDEYSADTKN